jgi:hypothetical protein
MAYLKMRITSIFSAWAEEGWSIGNVPNDLQ